MLSPKGTHSVNVGFDRNETGFVVSRNNGDAAMTAQAVLPIPHKEAEPVPDAAAEPAADAPAAAAPAAAADEDPLEEPALSGPVPAPPTRLAMTPSAADAADPAERRLPGGLPMLSPVEPK